MTSLSAAGRPGKPRPSAGGANKGAAMLRADAVRVLLSMIDRGQSLSDAVPDDAAPLLREIVYGVARWYWRLRADVDCLLNKPIRRKDQDLQLLMLVGVYQLKALRTPAHAAINETVSAAALFGKGWARGLVNGVLRNYSRRGGAPESGLSDEARYSHPEWLLRHIRQSWPRHWIQILEANNGRAPMVLRVNRRRVSRDEYLYLLREQGIGCRVDDLAEDGVILDKPLPVGELPEFRQGWVSVQDTAAQWAAPALPVRRGDRVLDACSAPGGKLTHILECYSGIGRVIAVERDSRRAALVRENLGRLCLSAELCVADAGDPDAWWDRATFDCVLLDAPCSASGVIRRHPDIKHLRRPGDLKALTSVQRQLLSRLWQTLAPGGHLMYATCSVFPEENDHQIDRFLSEHRDASVVGLDMPSGFPLRNGLQTLPGVHNVDGFYYALLKKSENVTPGRDVT